MNDERFASPMCVLPSGDHAFIRDCIKFEHSVYGTVDGIVAKFVYKVI